MLKALITTLWCISFLSLARYTIFTIGSLIYDVRMARLRYKWKQLPDFYPTITVIIPAYNEERTIISTVKSVVDCLYQANKISIIVANDGSTDKTAVIVQEKITSSKWTNVKLMSFPNQGKANTLNAVGKTVESELIMCLDADSRLYPDALLKAVQYFRDPSIGALSTNVRIRRNGYFLNLIQYFEYLTAWQVKRALSLYKIDYIIGGVGSTFRKELLESIGWYDTDTKVEDLDLTIKIIKSRRHDSGVVFASDVICDTEGVMTLRALFKQRFRWKSGHWQALYKHRDLFFSRKSHIPFQLGWLFLPYITISEILILLEPLNLIMLCIILLYMKSYLAICSGIAIVSIFVIIQIFAEDTLPLRMRIYLSIIAPATYFTTYIFSFNWFLSSIYMYYNWNKIKKDTSTNWTPVERENS